MYIQFVDVWLMVLMLWQLLEYYNYTLLEMLQHWASQGEFYIGGCVLRNFIELVRFVLHIDVIELNFNKPSRSATN